MGGDLFSIFCTFLSVAVPLLYQGALFYVHPTDVETTLKLREWRKIQSESRFTAQPVILRGSGLSRKFRDEFLNR